MKRLQVYLDTSIINFLFATDAPEKMEITINFFKETVATQRIDTWFSEALLQEVNQTKNDLKRRRLLGVLSDFPLNYLDLAPDEYDDAKKLSQVYLDAKAIRKSKPFDALHIALATIYRMDVLASWNFKDLANIQSERKIQLINNAQGFYTPLRICNPMGVR